MANPNIVNVSTIYGENTSVLLSTTNATLIIDNAASSGKIIKINTLIITNVDGVNTFPVTVRIYSAENLGGTGREIALNVDVPAKSTLVLIDKNSSLYLKENQSIGAQCATANELVVHASWEEIS